MKFQILPVINISTKINANQDLVFDLARSIDLHKISTQHTNEKAIAGKTSGLIDFGESVTWKAKHFGIYQTLTSKITAFDKQNYFVDEMVKGIFKSFKHEHHFEFQKGKTLMIDIIDYQSPLGILGRLADVLFLKKYMTNLLVRRNEVIKEFSETQKWKEIIESIH